MEFPVPTSSRALRLRAAATTPSRAPGRGRTAGAESMNVSARPAPVAPSDTTTASRPTRSPAPRFRTLARTELAYLWVSLERLGVPESRLEAATVEALRTLRRTLPIADSSSPLRAVLFACALRAARDHARTLPLSLARVVPVDDVLGRERDDAHAERRLPLLRALAAVPLTERAIFVLHELDGVSAPDVAAVVAASGRDFHLRAADVRAKIAALAALLLRLRGAPISISAPSGRALPVPVAELFLHERCAPGPSGASRQRLLEAIDAMRVRDDVGEPATGDAASADRQRQGGPSYAAA